MTTVFNYNVINSFPNQKVNLFLLENEIRNSNITVALNNVYIENINLEEEINLSNIEIDNIFYSGNVYITFKDDINNSNETLLNTIISNHSGNETMISSSVNQWKWDEWTENQILSKNTWKTVYSIENKGAVYGFIFTNDHDNISIKVVVDNMKVLELDLEKLHDIYKLNNNSNDWNAATSIPFIGEYESNKSWRVQPPLPFEFNTSFVIQLKGNDKDRELKHGMTTWRGR